MPNPQPVFGIKTTHQDDAYLVCIEGELDLATSPALELALEEAEHSDAARICLDLEELNFVDVSGLEAIFRASRRAASNGSRLQITRGKGSVADTIRLTGLDEVLPLTDASLVPDAGSR